MQRAHVINFGAGPSALPDSVLEEAARGLLNFDGTGIGITEVSHRSPHFGAVVSKLESIIRTQLGVPQTHHILFTQGGGSAQFAGIVLNMLARHRLLHPEMPEGKARTLDYVVTGSWSKKAADEAKRMAGPGASVNIVVDARQASADGKTFEGIPSHDTFKFSEDPVLVYYCENETVDGVQFAEGAESPASFPFHLMKGDKLPVLVTDYSSSFMSRRIPRLEDHAIIFAGAQKNIGPAGLTIIIVRQDCIVDVDAAAALGASPVPITMAYKTLASSSSLYNTPPMFPMYVSLLVLEKMEEKGGLAEIEAANRRKMQKVYAAVDEGEKKGLFKFKVKADSRSWMNVVFAAKDPEIEKAFLSQGEAQGLKAMKGHRSVGGFRISLYNAITEQQVDKLVQFIRDFVGAQ